MPLQNQLQLLVVGYETHTLLMLERIFHREGFIVKCVASEKFELDAAIDFSPSVILIDTPSGINSTVVDILSRLRSNREIAHVPTVAILSRADAPNASEYGLEADDLIFKPFDPRDAIARVLVKLKIKSLQDQLRYFQEPPPPIKQDIEHVFISYSRNDSEYAYRLVEKMTDRGFVPWIDKRQLGSSDEWWESIIRALRECAAFVIIMTPEARNSKWVNKELMLAQEWNKPTFPLLLRGERWEIFVDIQYDDVRDGLLPSSLFWERLAKVALIYG